MSDFFLFNLPHYITSSVGSVSGQRKKRVEILHSIILLGRGQCVVNEFRLFLFLWAVLCACIILKRIINSFHSDECSHPYCKYSHDTSNAFPVALLRFESGCHVCWGYSFYFLFTQKRHGSLRLFFLPPISHFSSSFFNSHRRGGGHWFLHLIAKPIAHPHCALCLSLQWPPNLILEEK